MEHHNKSILSFSSTIGLACLFTVGLCLFPEITTAENGNNLPHEAKGFQESSYSLSDYESINLANGNLTWRLPLYTLHTDGGLTYDLALHYNSKIWYTYSYCSYGASGYQTCPESSFLGSAQVADGVKNYGLGWDLRPPRIYLMRETDRFRDKRYSHIFVDQSGARHSLHDDYAWASQGEDNVFFTQDGTNLRFTFDDAENPSSAVMDDGNGTRYIFEQLVPATCDVVDGHPEPDDTDYDEFNFRMEVAGLYLTQIERGPWFEPESDVFVAANRIRFEYRGESATSNLQDCSESPNERWLLRRVTANGINGGGGQIEREVIFDYTDSYLSSVQIPLFDPTLGDSDLSDGYETIRITMETRTIEQKNVDEETCGSSDICLPYEDLSEILFPNGAQFTFNESVTYPLAGENLREVTLPTGAKVSYQFGEWVLGTGLCTDEPGRTDPVWRYCGAPTNFLCGSEPGISHAVMGRGVKRLDMTFRDSATKAPGDPRAQTTVIGNSLDCSTKPGFQTSNMWPYDFRFAFVDDPAGSTNDYLWTVVYCCRLRQTA